MRRALRVSGALLAALCVVLPAPQPPTLSRDDMWSPPMVSASGLTRPQMIGPMSLVHQSHAEQFGWLFERHPTRERIRARAEWEPVDGVIMGAHGFNDWGLELATRILQTGVRLFLIIPIAESDGDDPDEPDPDETIERVLDAAIHLDSVDQVTFLFHDTIGDWVRDYAPYSVDVISETRTRRGFIDAIYASDRNEDDAFPQMLTEHLTHNEGRQILLREVPVTIEWGNFMTDGRGTCAVTTSIFDANDHLDDSIAQVEAVLYRELGCEPKSLIVLPQTERTIGHIDEVAKFLPGRRVMVSDLRYVMVGHKGTRRWLPLTESEKDAADTLDAIADIFEEAGFTPIRLPMLPPLTESEEHVMRSYVNSTFVNGHLLVPSYINAGASFRRGRVRDLEAQVHWIYRHALPGYEIHTVEASEAVELEGSVHCLTMGIALPTAEEALGQPQTQTKGRRSQ